jgi:hypothetical protein
MNPSPLNNLINTSAWTQSFLWASMIWGAIGSGYLLYGWRQKSMYPFIGGAAITVVACFVPALPMTLICIALMYAVWWFMKRGY